MLFTQTKWLQLLIDRQWSPHCDRSNINFNPLKMLKMTFGYSQFVDHRVLPLFPTCQFFTTSYKTIWSWSQNYISLSVSVLIYCKYHRPLNNETTKSVRIIVNGSFRRCIHKLKHFHVAVAIWINEMSATVIFVAKTWACRTLVVLHFIDIYREITSHRNHLCWWKATTKGPFETTIFILEPFFMGFSYSALLL